MLTPLTRLTAILARTVCRLRGHKFRKFSDGFKRACDRCGREEWVMSRPYPLIGEAKHYWHHMDWPTR